MHYIIFILGTNLKRKNETVNLYWSVYTHPRPDSSGTYLPHPNSGGKERANE